MPERTRVDKQNLIYSIAKPEELEEVAQFAAEHFFNSSPIREFASFDEVSDETERFAVRKARLRNCLSHLASILVREKSTGCIIAFAAFILEENQPSDSTLKTNYSSNIIDRQSPGWLNKAIGADINRGIDLYARYGTDRIMHYWIAVVRSDYRGQRVFGLMNNDGAFRSLAVKIAIENKAGVWKAEAFSHYFGMEKDWQLIKSIDLDDYQLPDGTRPLAGVDLGVHRTVRLLACRVPPTLL